MKLYFCCAVKLDEKGEAAELINTTPPGPKDLFRPATAVLLCKDAEQAKRHFLRWMLDNKLITIADVERAEVRVSPFRAA